MFIIYVLLLVMAVAYGFLLGLDCMAARVKELEEELGLFELIDDAPPVHVRACEDVQ